jgi:protoporphyrin/coproporphyrin ferrochelatase
MPRRAIVLMNLGGPDSPEAVEPFLVNLFSDPAIIRLPLIVRWPLARLIARRRAGVARDIYDHLGGGSPLLANTRAQGEALEAVLGDGSRCFIAMRYWHPLTEEAVAEVKNWHPDEVVCLPLYPQYSTTTTGSSLTAWQRAAKREGLGCPTRVIDPYPTAGGFIAALAGLIAPVLEEAERSHKVRLLLSAHGLPLKIVQAGDPYPNQINQTAEAVVAALDRPDLDWTVCYQSRVGPLAWLGPQTDEEIKRAGRDGIAVVVAAISFVSEHSETLVELDRDYRRLAKASAVPAYYRVPTVGTDPRFIAALAELVRGAA